jgi:opacity protein-like surface antigen
MVAYRGLTGAVVLAWLLLASAATAGKGWYLSIEAGIGDPAADNAYLLTSYSGGGLGGPLVPQFTSFGSDDGFVGLAAFGAHLAENFRLELEASRRSTKFGPIDIDQSAVLLNAAFDIALARDLSLSLGAGAGLDLISMDAAQSSEDDAVPAVQLTAGLAYAIADSTEILLTLRHFGAPGSELGQINGLLGDAVVENLSDTSVTIGLRFAL